MHCSEKFLYYFYITNFIIYLNTWTNGYNKDRNIELFFNFVINSVQKCKELIYCQLYTA